MANGNGTSDVFTRVLDAAKTAGISTVILLGMLWGMYALGTRAIDTFEPIAKKAVADQQAFMAELVNTQREHKEVLQKLLDTRGEERRLLESIDRRLEEAAAK